jgi:hypothetical protein
VGNTAITERIAATLKRKRYRRMVVAYDARETPPWTAEVYDGNTLVALRTGTTLQAAITAVQKADL